MFLHKIWILGVFNVLYVTGMRTNILEISPNHSNQKFTDFEICDNFHYYFFRVFLYLHKYYKLGLKQFI